MARLGYFLWIAGSLKASIISNLVGKKTKFLADPCTSPSWGKKSTACITIRIEVFHSRRHQSQSTEKGPGVWSPRKDRTDQSSSPSWRELGLQLNSYRKIYCLFENCSSSTPWIAVMDGVYINIPSNFSPVRLWDHIHGGKIQILFIQYEDYVPIFLGNLQWLASLTWL